MSSSNLVDKTLKKFANSKKLLTNIYDDFLQYHSILVERIGWPFVHNSETMQLSLTTEDEAYIHKILNSDPIIILSGQINSGKTSLLNELLEGSYFPAKCIPCTARIVKVKFSEKNYLQVYRRDEKVGDEISFSKKVPQDKIDLDQTSRSDSEKVECIVEVGLNHGMLQSGLQIYDVPGLGESEALDRIVKESLDGMLQLMIYVIDGKKSLSSEDRNFLNHIKRQAPRMKIIYVCNKTEDDNVARRMDSRSDDDDSGDDVRPNRALLAFNKLKKAKLLPSDLRYEDEKDMFHGISCVRVRSARLAFSKNGEKINEEFTNQFDCFKNGLFKCFDECIDTQLYLAVHGLLDCQRRLFDFFISERLHGGQKHELIEAILAIERKESELYNNLNTEIDKERSSLIQSVVDSKLDSIADDVVSEIENMPCGSVNYAGTGNVDWTQFVDIFKSLARDYVMVHVLYELETEIQNFALIFKGDILRSYLIISVVSNDTDVQCMLCNHLASLRDQAEIQFDPDIVKDLLTDSISTDCMSTVREEDVQISNEWKRSIGFAIFHSIDRSKLISNIVDALKEQLTVDHIRFITTMNQIKELCQIPEPNSGIRLTELIHGYNTTLCLCEALASTLKHGNVIVGRKIGEGSRMQVFECQKPNHGENLAVKIFRNEPAPNEDFAALFCCTRLLPDVYFTGKVRAVAYDDQWRFCILVSKYDQNLFDLLNDGYTLSLQQSLDLCYDTIELCIRALEFNITLSDLRVNNFFTTVDKDGRYALSMDLSKWKSQEAPYPDGKPNFHFAPETFLRIGSENGTAEVYSLVVLLVQLILGRFVRPNFAESEDTDPMMISLTPMTEDAKRKVLTKYCSDYLQVFQHNWSGSTQCLFFIKLTELIKKYIGCVPSDRGDMKRLRLDVDDLRTCLKNGGLLEDSLSEHAAAATADDDIEIFF